MTKKKKNSNKISKQLNTKKTSVIKKFLQFSWAVLLFMFTKTNDIVESIKFYIEPPFLPSSQQIENHSKYNIIEI